MGGAGAGVGRGRSPGWAGPEPGVGGAGARGRGRSRGRAGPETGVGGAGAGGDGSVGRAWPKVAGFWAPDCTTPSSSGGTGEHWEASQLITDTPRAQTVLFRDAQIPEEKPPRSWGVDLGGLLCLVSAPG